MQQGDLQSPFPPSMEICERMRSSSEELKKLNFRERLLAISERAPVRDRRSPEHALSILIDSGDWAERARRVKPTFSSASELTEASLSERGGTSTRELKDAEPVLNPLFILDEQPTLIMLF